MNRVHTYPIINEEKTKELNIIQDTLYNNEYKNKNINTRHPRNKNTTTKLQANSTKQQNGLSSRIMEKKQKKS
jgi:hypothetical protein